MLTRAAKSCTTILSSRYTPFRSVASPQQEQLQEPPGLGNRSEELLPGGELAALKNTYLLQIIGDVDDLLAGDANNDIDQLLDHSCLFMDNSEVQRSVERGMAPSSAPCFSRYSYCPQSPLMALTDKAPCSPFKPLVCSRVSVLILRRGQVPLDCQQHAGVGGDRVVEQGMGIATG